MPNGAPHRSPNVAAQSHGVGAPAGACGTQASAASPATTGFDEADEAAQLAAALAASKLDQGPARRPPASVAPTAPSGGPSLPNSPQCLKEVESATLLSADVC